MHDSHTGPILLSAQHLTVLETVATRVWPPLPPIRPWPWSDCTTRKGPMALVWKMEWKSLPFRLPKGSMSAMPALLMTTCMV